MNLNPYEFCELLGIKKTAYYNKINGITDWTLPELIKLSQLAKKHGLDIYYCGDLYRITVKKV